MNINFNLNRIYSLFSLIININNTLVFGLKGYNISTIIFFDLNTKKIPGGS